ncbi:MAG: 3'-5' exonuclease [Chloroflexota bacterium]|nr:3'-5' exonuclease [Chloroflexota bacterium]
MAKHIPPHAQRCPRCRQPTDARSAPGYCAAHHAAWQQQRCGAVAWARWAVATRNVVVLDTETTGLDDQAEVLEIALLSTHGAVLCDSLIRPQGPIPAAATAVHHLDAAAVAHAPTFRELYPRLAALLRKRFVVVYNAAFDRRVLDQTCTRYGLPALRPAALHCAMLEYAKFTGVWNATKQDYTWHKLQGADHSALGDCRATLATIEWMAEGRD